MTQRNSPKEARAKIVAASIPIFAKKGFNGASTREIASAADTSQGLLTYHFKNKNELWRAAVDALFARISDAVGDNFLDDSRPQTEAEKKDSMRRFLKFQSEHPYMLKFIIEGGQEWNERSEYLINTHLRDMYERFCAGLPEHTPPDFAPHIFYAWLGASVTMFSIPAECKALSGIDPQSDQAIERHLALLNHLFIPSNPIKFVFKQLKRRVFGKK